MIGVPEGRNHYYEEAERAKAQMIAEGSASAWGFFTWPSADILPAEEIAAAREDLDELTFQQEYEASFVNFTGRAYHAFTDANKAKLRERYNPRADLLLCFDFNVSPGVAVIAQEMALPGDGLEEIDGTGVIGEVWIPRNSDTVKVCEKFADDWCDHEGRILIYGDATGGAKGTAKVLGSDWDLVRATLPRHFGQRQLSYRVPSSNPRERVRINALNSRCCSVEGIVRLMVDPKHAPRTVRDLEGVRLLEGGSGEIDKKHDLQLTHLTDALGYMIAKEHPIIERQIRTARLGVV